MKNSRGNTGTFCRVVKQASICLLLGAIVNVAVAWGYAWFGPTTSRFSREVDLGSDEDFVGAFDNVWEEYFPTDRFQEMLRPQAGWTLGEGGLRFDTIRGDIRGLHGPPFALLLVRSGFPMNCLSYHYWYLLDDDQTTVEFFDARYALLWDQHAAGPYFDRIVALPLRPLWPAFAINTIFYSVILWLLFIGTFIVRRKLRIRRGLCLNCGYDLRGDFESGCSECGWNRKDAE